jgi:uncharacterized protein
VSQKSVTRSEGQPVPAPAHATESAGPPVAPPGPRSAISGPATSRRQRIGTADAEVVAEARNDGVAVGMPMVAAGSIAFALAVSGYVPVGALVPILVVAVIGEIVAARWAYRDGQTDFGRIFIAFAGFWLTYVGLVLGLSHEWFGVAPEESTMAIVLFMVTWLTVMILVTLANLEMPLVITLTLLALDVALVLLVTGTLVGMDMLFSAAATALFISAALACYACVATTGPTALRRILPVGAAVLRPSALITIGEDDYAAVSTMHEPAAQHSET